MSLNKLALLVPVFAVGCLSASAQDDGAAKADAAQHSVSVAPVLLEGETNILMGAASDGSSDGASDGSSDGSSDSSGSSADQGGSSDGATSGETTTDDPPDDGGAGASDGSSDGSAGGSADAGTDGSDGSADAGSDAGAASGSDAGADSGADAGSDAGSGSDAGADAGSDSTGAATGDVFGAYSLYVDGDSNYADQADSWRSSAPDDAALMDAMAAQPLAVWLGEWTSDPTSTVDRLITAGGSQLRTLVVYNIPNRDCGAWSSGGAADASEYADFVGKVAAGIDGRPVLVVLEPDALPLTKCLSDSQAEERYDMMGEAVDVLTAAGASVYIDAGDSHWIDAETIADKLVKANVATAAGFSLNVSHTEYETDEMGFAEELRAIIGEDAHYVIDTSRSGLGPNEAHEWCNPFDTAVGTLPTTVTGIDGLDAYLWIKPPGESDGSCNGGPSAGHFWAEYALELAALSTTL